jgi:hypothetical protein
VGRDLFQIFGTDDIYFTLDMWAKLSSRHVKKDSIRILTIAGTESGQQAEQAPAVTEQIKDTYRVL